MSHVLGRHGKLTILLPVLQIQDARRRMMQEQALQKTESERREAPVGTLSYLAENLQNERRNNLNILQ